VNEIRFWRAVVCLLALGVALLALVKVFTVLLPFVFGLLLAYLVSPLVDQFTALGWKRCRVVVVLYLALLTVGVVLCVWLLPPLFHQANQTLESLPKYARMIDDLILRLNGEIQKFAAPMMGARAKSLMLSCRADDLMAGLLAKLPENLVSVAHAGMWFIIIPFVCFFGLSRGKHWIDALFNLTPSRHVESLLGFMAEINATLGAYLRGVMIESLCVGLLTIVGLHCMGVDNAVLIGVITALVNPIPFMAPIIGGGLALLMVYFQCQSVSMLLAVATLFVSIRLVDDFVLIPFVLGRSVHLHPVVMVFAVLAGVELGGFLGLVFAIPVTVVLKVVLSLMFRGEQGRFFIQRGHVVT
jgi:predicted PurR-regulated permease PerM